jgi:uncharacterized protein YdaU (DUF1376 family)
MNFYKHHIGDYDSATAHLSWEEDLAYLRLLRIYYRDEKPLPLDITKCARLVRASSTKQIAAVREVIHSFFTEMTDGWHNKRADEEIFAAKRQSQINRRTALEREAARRREEEQTSGKSSNGQHDSLHDSDTNRSQPVHDSFTATVAFREPIQTPDSRLLDSKTTKKKTRPKGAVDKSKNARLEDIARLQAWASEIGCALKPDGRESPGRYEARIESWKRAQSRPGGEPVTVAKILGGAK